MVLDFEVFQIFKEVSPYVLLLISINPLGFQLSIDGSITQASLLIYEYMRPCLSYLMIVTLSL